MARMPPAPEGPGASKRVRHAIADSSDLLLNKGPKLARVPMAWATAFLVKVLGKGLKGVGGLDDSGLRKGAEAAERKEAQASGISSKLAYKASALTCRTAAGSLRLIRSSGAKLDQRAVEIGTGVAAAVVGAAETVSGSVDALAITKADLGELSRQLLQHGDRIREIAAKRLARVERSAKARHKADALDRTLIGGVSLADMLRAPGRISDDVLNAYRAAYPSMAAKETFAEAVQRMDERQLEGFASAVKGKLFELRLVDSLNSGQLPPGYEASMAVSANQKAWDIKITGPDGEVVELLQAKASSSTHYVQEALSRYPDIDVVTTDEVYAQLLAVGASESVRSGGVSLDELNRLLDGSFDIASDAVDWSDLAPSGLGMVLVGLSVYLDDSLTSKQKASAFGDRSARLAVAGMLSKSAMAATQLWGVALAAGIASHWLATKGRQKRAHLDGLRKALGLLERMRCDLPPRPGGQSYRDASEDVRAPITTGRAAKRRSRAEEYEKAQSQSSARKIAARAATVAASPVRTHAGPADAEEHWLSWPLRVIGLVFVIWLAIQWGSSIQTSTKGASTGGQGSSPGANWDEYERSRNESRPVPTATSAGSSRGQATPDLPRGDIRHCLDLKDPKKVAECAERR